MLLDQFFFQGEQGDDVACPDKFGAALKLLTDFDEIIKRVIVAKYVGRRYKRPPPFLGSVSHAIQELWR